MAADEHDALEEFQDPLENYDPKTFDDPLERALAEQTVGAIETRPFASVSPDATVEEAVHNLAGLHVACLLVVEDGKLVGVFTDRDVLDRVALEYPAIKSKSLRDFMTPDPVVVYESDPAAAALAVMAVSGFRHVPVVDASDTVVGIISPQRVTNFLKQQFEQALDG